jgi:hypothetical protein
MITVQSYINSFFAFRRGLSSCILPRFVLHGTEFLVVFSSGEWFRTEFREFASIFGPRNGIPSCFLFRRRVQNGIPRICVYFWSKERNSELFSLPQKGSERNSERFLLRGTAGITSEIPLCSVYSVLRGIIFLSEIPHSRVNDKIPILSAMFIWQLKIRCLFFFPLLVFTNYKLT